jgi:hypothetical protein
MGGIGGAVHGERCLGVELRPPSPLAVKYSRLIERIAGRVRLAAAGPAAKSSQPNQAKDGEPAVKAAGQSHLAPLPPDAALGPLGALAPSGLSICQTSQAFPK